MNSFGAGVAGAPLVGALRVVVVVVGVLIAETSLAAVVDLFALSGGVR